MIEKSFDVDVHHESVSFLNILQDTFDGLMTVAAGSEAKRVVVKLWFKDRLNEATNHLLRTPRVHSGDAERPSFIGVSLWDVDSS